MAFLILIGNLILIRFSSLSKIKLPSTEFDMRSCTLVYNVFGINE